MSEVTNDEPSNEKDGLSLHGSISVEKDKHESVSPLNGKEDIRINVGSYVCVKEEDAPKAIPSPKRRRKKIQQV